MKFSGVLTQTDGKAPVPVLGWFQLVVCEDVPLWAGWIRNRNKVAFLPGDYCLISKKWPNPIIILVTGSPGDNRYFFEGQGPPPILVASTEKTAIHQVNSLRRLRLLLHLANVMSVEAMRLGIRFLMHLLAKVAIGQNVRFPAHS